MEVSDYKLRTALLAVFAFLLVGNIYSQTFVCTDVNFYDSDMSAEDILQRKLEGLGSKAVLSFYDESLKIIIMDEKGKQDGRPLLLDKINDKEYRICEKDGESQGCVKIKLSKWIAYIRSFTLETYENDRLALRLFYKRD